jgi:hypothetical protein
MAKRQGKAATRRQRQRSANRTARPATPSMPARGPDALDRAEPITETVATPTTEPTAPAVSPPSVTSRVRPPRRGTPLVGGGSRLTEQAAAEYHYVTADLRNIGMLFLAIVALLAVAFVVIEVLGIGRVAT